MITKIKRLLKHVSLKPFDTSTVEGQNQERLRRIAISSLMNILVRLSTILTQIISVPILIGHLGKERYGLWMTISATLLLLRTVDLGVANGLVNAVAKADGQKDKLLARKYISSAYLIETSLAIGLGIVFAFVYPLISWDKLFNVSSEMAVREVGPTFAIFIGTFLFSLFTNVAEKVRLGFQEEYINSMFIIAGNLFALTAIVIATFMDANLPVLVLILSGSLPLFKFINGILLFGWNKRDVFPGKKFIKKESMQEIINIGVMFFFFQLVMALNYASDNYITTRLFGSEFVPEYSVPWKLSYFSILILHVFLTPIWPAFSEALSKGNVAWIKNIYRKTVGLGLFFNFSYAVVFILGGSWIIDKWTVGEIHPPKMMLISLGIWIFLSGFQHPVSILLRGCNVLLFQIVTIFLMLISKIVLSLYFANAFGVTGVAHANVISQLVFVIIPAIVYVPKVIKKLEEQAANNH